MKKQIIFRFDIDTHVCIRDGVPKLIELGKKYNVPFTFFLNTGKSVSICSSIKTIISNILHPKATTVAEHLSALEKLGKKDYIYTALINPQISAYKKNILMLLTSKNEVGLHGGKNHELWAKNIYRYGYNKIRKELEYSVNRIKKIYPKYKPCGFASPCWETNTTVKNVLVDLGFQYAADVHTIDINTDITYYRNLACIPTNLIAEPGGVAYFEHCRAKKMTDEDIINDFFSRINNQRRYNVVYDHPYFVGKKEIPLLEKIIILLLQNNFTITTMSSLL